MKWKECVKSKAYHHGLVFFNSFRHKYSSSALGKTNNSQHGTYFPEITCEVPVQTNTSKRHDKLSKWMEVVVILFFRENMLNPISDCNLIADWPFLITYFSHDLISQKMFMLYPYFSAVVSKNIWKVTIFSMLQSSTVLTIQKQREPKQTTIFIYL